MIMLQSDMVTILTYLFPSTEQLGFFFPGFRLMTSSFLLKNSAIFADLRLGPV